MNKKFSTLMASALLATSVGAFAQTYSPTALSYASGDTEILAGKYYSLNVDGSGTEVVAINANADGSLAAKVVTTSTLNTLAKVDSALWTVTSKVTNNGGVTRFVLTNKATGVTLSFDPKKAAKGAGASLVAGSTELGGVLTEWKWYDDRYNSSADELATWARLSMSFSNANEDSTLFIKRDASNILYAAKESQRKSVIGNDVTLQIRKPGNWVMSPEDLNTKGSDVKYMQLSFAEDIESNPFADKYQAQIMDFTGTADYHVKVNRASNPNAGYSTFTGAVDYLFLNKVGDDGKLTYNYLRLDTAYYEGSGDDFKKYNTLKTAPAILQKDANGNNVQSANEYNVIDSIAYNIPDDAFRFKFTKNLMTDSIRVESLSQFVELSVGQTPKNHKGTAVTYWTMLTQDAAVDPLTGTGFATNAKTGVHNNTEKYTILSHITLEDENKNVVTFFNDDATRPVENWVNLWASAGADADFTSIADGVYTIKDAETGEYLGVHIYSADSIATFTGNEAIANMNFNHIPAFQWVVLKTDRASEDRLAVSPLRITNREFDNNAYVNIQLTKGSKDGQYKLAAINREVIFTPVEKEYISDKYLGYKNLSDNDLKVNRYTFNYWHSFDQNHYLSMAAEDTLLNALETTPDRFKITGNKEAEYGYVLTNDAKTYIPDLVRLVRRSYTVELQGVGTVYSNKENQFMVTKQASATDDALAVFFFKENNEFEKGEETLCYYALIDTTGIDTKAGVVDNDEKALLWQQVIGESRTSVFAVEKDDAPLYRRFNSALLEGNAGDGPDTLRFVEKYRGEYLQMEANSNFVKEGIDFLGINDANDAEGGLAFIVDTAFVERWNGNIKPQYLISIDRKDQAFEAGEMCPVCQEIVAAGGERPANCPHDKAGKLPFHMGKYLVNFADSATNAVNPADYKWAGYTRAGFVKAAHMGDSLFILKDQFADWTLADFDTAVIKKAVADKEYAKENIVNLQKDTHKKVTWSMRFVNPEDAAQEVEDARSFLFESLADAGQPDIAPAQGQWLKMQNGCLVMSGSFGDPSTSNEVTGGDDALIFNVEQYAGDDDLATDNEEITASEVTVIAGNGQITINGAAGKQVVVSNILGQVVANTVLTSDNATIAAPQGVVVVAVEGEEAVKAIVK